MKFELNNRLINRLIGISMAAAVIVSCNVASQISDIRTKRACVTANSVSIPQSSDNSEKSTVIIPFNENINDGLQEDSRKLYEVYSRIAETEQTRSSRTTHETTVGSDSQTCSQTVAETTTTTTAQTTSQTTVDLSQTLPGTNTTEPRGEQTVSNGRLPFNYNDVSSIAANMNDLGDFVDKLQPSSFGWDTSEYSDHGYVQITLTSAIGGITLDVKPMDQEEDAIEPYTIDGEVTGTVNAGALSDLDWYKQNKESGCGICSVTWLKPGFAVDPVRGIDVGTGLAELTDNYLCVNGGATTLYKAADVIEDQDKLSALLASENAYTFVGGRLYTMGGYLDKYYSGRTDSYQFADCDMVVQYGCNSIIDHNYISGSWIIEYAINNDTVAGITFMNKSYYKDTKVHGGATSSSTGTSFQNEETVAPVTPEVQTTATTTAQKSTERTDNVKSGENLNVTEANGIDVKDSNDDFAEKSEQELEAVA